MAKNEQPKSPHPSATGTSRVAGPDSTPESEAPPPKTPAHPAPRKRLAKLGGEELFHTSKVVVDKINEIVEYLDRKSTRLNSSH